MYTSTITDTEYFVHPYREKDFLKISVGEDIAEKAAQIRAKYQGIKTADSLQLASAIVYECDVFLTNDKQLRQVEEIRVLLVDDL